MRRLLPLLLVLGCARAPGDSRFGQLATGWIDHVVAGRDVEAMAGMSLSPGDPTDFDVVKLTKRLDRLDWLRTHDRVEWTGLTYAPPPRWNDKDVLGSLFLRGLMATRPVVTLDGLIWRGSESVDVSLRVIDGTVRDVRVGPSHVVPLHTYFVVPREPPVDEPLALRELTVAWETVGESEVLRMSALAEVSQPGVSLGLTTTCLEGDRFYRHTIQAARTLEGVGWQPVSLSSARAQRWEQCEVQVELGQAQRQRGVWCLLGEELAVGACAVRPMARRQGPHGVTVDEVSLETIGGGATVHYTLYANVPLPEEGSMDRATVFTELRCGGVSQPTHGRPVRANVYTPGVHYRLGSVFVGDDLTPPCEIGLRYVRDDDYDREEALLYEGGG